MEQVELAKILLELGQSHLFEHWAEPGVDDNEKKAFFDQAFSFSFLTFDFLFVFLTCRVLWGNCFFLSLQ